MISAVQSEFNRLKKNITVYLVLGVLICMQILLTAVQIALFQGAEVNGINEPYTLNLVWYTSTSVLFSILYAITINYQIISKEYSNKTWELLILTIKNKNKVIFSKFIVASILQIICQIISFILFIMILSTYYRLENNLVVALPFFLMACFGNFFLSACVFCIHLMTSNGMVAIALTIPLILLPSFFSKFIILGKYIPFMTVGYFLNISMNMSLLINFLLCIYSIFCGVILIYIVSRFFHL